MRYLIIFLIAIQIFASSYETIKNIIGKEKFEIYKNLIYTSLDKNASLKETITFLENNALLDLYSNGKESITPKFIFLNNNPIFNTKTLYDSLYYLGYINFYPIFIEKSKTYTIQLKIKSNHYLAPLNLLNELNKRGCSITDIKKNKNFIYYINCKNEKLKAYILKNDIQILHKIKGIYWLDSNNFKKIYIKTSKYDFFHPYIVFYDKNLNILNIITSTNVKRKLILKIPQNTKYIKIKDYFTKENIKRGIFIKGLK